MNPDAHRKALHQALKARVIPHILALGFDKTGTQAGRERWPGEAKSGWDYARRRGAMLDRLHIRWEKYGDPWFVIDFETALEGAPPRDASLQMGEIQTAWSKGLLRRLNYPGRWFGRGHDPEIAADLAISGLDQLDEFLRTGHAGRQIRRTMIHGELAGPRRMHPVEWALTIVVFLVVLPVTLAKGVFESAAESLSRSRRKR
jgi:hypothetical protein